MGDVGLARNGLHRSLTFFREALFPLEISCGCRGAVAASKNRFRSSMAKPGEFRASGVAGGGQHRVHGVGGRPSGARELE